MNGLLENSDLAIDGARLDLVLHIRFLKVLDSDNQLRACTLSRAERPADARASNVQSRDAARYLKKTIIFFSCETSAAVGCCGVRFAAALYSPSCSRYWRRRAPPELASANRIVTFLP